MLPEEIIIDETELQKNQPEFTLASGSQITKQPAPLSFLVDQYLPEKSLCELHGPAGCGKSFIALDIGFCISNEIPWHGRKVKGGPVAYIAGEGFSGIGQRLRSLELKHNRSAENLLISRQPAGLSDEKNAVWVGEAIRKHDPVLIIIDTVSRNFGGSDENSTRDMAAFISNIDNFIKQESAVLLVHHTGHMDKSRARGSSVLNAALDAEFSISKNESVIKMVNTKMKDTEPPDGISFQMTPRILDWKNEDDSQVKCITLSEIKFQTVNVEKPRISAKDEAILNSLKRAISKHGVSPSTQIKELFGGFAGNRKVVHGDYWKEEAYHIIDTDSAKDPNEAKRSALNRAKNKLRGKFIETMDDYWWCIDD